MHNMHNLLYMHLYTDTHTHRIQVYTRTLTHIDNMYIYMRSDMHLHVCGYFDFTP